MGRKRDIFRAQLISHILQRALKWDEVPICLPWVGGNLWGLTQVYKSTLQKSTVGLKNHLLSAFNTEEC